MTNGVRVRLTAIEAEFCDWLGESRWQLRRQHGSVHTNNRRISDGQATAADQLGARCECAGKTYLWMTEWHIEPLADPSQVVDLEHPLAKIDVKGVPQHRLSLISPAAAIKPAWVYLLISAQEHPWYWIRGWCRGDVFATVPLRELQRGRPCRTIGCDSPLLREPAELLRIVAGGC